MILKRYFAPFLLMIIIYSIVISVYTIRLKNQSERNAAVYRKLISSGQIPPNRRDRSMKRRLDYAFPYYERQFNKKLSLNKKKMLAKKKVKIPPRLSDSHYNDDDLSYMLSNLNLNQKDYTNVYEDVKTKPNLRKSFLTSYSGSNLRQDSIDKEELFATSDKSIKTIDNDNKDIVTHPVKIAQDAVYLENKEGSKNRNKDTVKQSTNNVFIDEHAIEPKNNPVESGYKKLSSDDDSKIGLNHFKSNIKQNAEKGIPIKDNRYNVGMKKSVLQNRRSKAVHKDDSRDGSDVVQQLSQEDNVDRSSQQTKIIVKDNELVTVEDPRQKHSKDFGKVKEVNDIIINENLPAEQEPILRNKFSGRTPSIHKNQQENRDTTLTNRIPEGEGEKATTAVNNLFFENRNEVAETYVPEIRNSVAKNRNDIDENRSSVDENRNIVNENRNSVGEDRHVINENRNSPDENRNAVDKNRNVVYESKNSVHEDINPVAENTEPEKRIIADENRGPKQKVLQEDGASRDDELIIKEETAMNDPQEGKKLDSFKESSLENKPVMGAPQRQTKGNKPDVVVIMTESRSGSTWLMNTLSFPDNVMFFFEPLNSRVSDRFLRSLQEGETEEEALVRWRMSKLAGICNCKLSIRDVGTTSGWQKNYSPEVLKQMRMSDVERDCKTKAIKVAKPIRLYDISELKFLPSLDCSNFKVIHLVRDPRAVMMSRMLTFHELYDGNKKLGPYIRGSLEAFSDEYVAKASNDYCSHHTNSIRFSRESWLASKYLRVRYEDFARAPEAAAREMYHFIGQSYTAKVRDYVYESTHQSQGAGGYGTFKNTLKVLDSWKKKILLRHLDVIDRECKELMQTLDYKPGNYADS